MGYPHLSGVGEKPLEPKLAPSPGLSGWKTLRTKGVGRAELVTARFQPCVLGWEHSAP